MLSMGKALTARGEQRMLAIARSCGPATTAPAEKKKQMIHFEDLPDILTRRELQTYLRLGRNTIYDLLNDGTIASVRVNQKFLIPKAGVRDFLERAGEAIGAGIPVKGTT